MIFLNINEYMLHNRMQCIEGFIESATLSENKVHCCLGLERRGRVNGDKQILTIMEMRVGQSLVMFVQSH